MTVLQVLCGAPEVQQIPPEFLAQAKKATTKPRSWRASAKAQPSPKERSRAWCWRRAPRNNLHVRRGGKGVSGQPADGPSLPALDSAPPKSLTSLFNTNLNSSWWTMQSQSSTKISSACVGCVSNFRNCTWSLGKQVFWGLFNYQLTELLHQKITSSQHSVKKQLWMHSTQLGKALGNLWKSLENNILWALGTSQSDSSPLWRVGLRAREGCGRAEQLAAVAQPGSTQNCRWAQQELGKLPQDLPLGIFGKEGTGGASCKHKSFGKLQKCSSRKNHKQTNKQTKREQPSPLSVLSTVSVFWQYFHPKLEGKHEIAPFCGELLFKSQTPWECLLSEEFHTEANPQPYQHSCQKLVPQCCNYHN